MYRNLFDSFLLAVVIRKQNVIGDRFVTHTCETHSGLVNLLFCICNDGDRCSSRDHCSRPRSKLSAETDVDGIGNVTRSVNIVWPDVEHDTVEMDDVRGGKFFWRSDLVKTGRALEIPRCTL